jgi:hypothetical protein
LSSSQKVQLSSTASGSGAKIRPGIAAHRPANNTIFKPTRSGKVPKQTVFSDSVMQLVTEFKAVHLKKDESGLVQAPASSFKAITLEEAMREDAPK